MRVLADHLKEVGKGLDKATTAYNQAVGSLEAKVFPAARRFHELGVVSGTEIPEVEPVETTPRIISRPELVEQKEEEDDTEGV
jgi:DNA recombination protein RmuC